MKLFDLDGPVYRIGTEVADFMILTLYWFLGCLPIITIGASTSSLLYVFGKKIRGEDSYITKDFVKAFRQNFKQSIPLTVLLLILWLSVLSYFMILLGYNGQAPFSILVLALVFMIEVSLFSVYSLGILSRFHMKFTQIIITSFVLAHRHVLTSILILGGLFVIIQISSLNPLLFLLIPTGFLGFASVFLQKIFSVHIAAAEELKKAQENQIEEVEEQLIEEVEESHRIVDQEVKGIADKATEKAELKQEKETEENQDFLNYI